MMKNIHPKVLNMRGYFAEIEQEGKNCFIEIRDTYFDIKQYEYLIEIDCLKESVLWDYLYLLNELPKQNQFIYKVLTYIADETLSNSWDFNESIENYKEYGFATIEEVLVFLAERYNLKISDFVPQEETNIP